MAAISAIPHPCAGKSGRNVYLVALVLALVSGFSSALFRCARCSGPIRTRSSKRDRQARFGRRITVRDVLLVVQIAICAVLVTSSMVAVRGLVRSMHSNFGFEPRNAMLVDTDLTMAGYSGDRVPAMQRRMIDAMQDDSRRRVRGIGELVRRWNGAVPGKDCLYRHNHGSEAIECRGRPPICYNISPEYFRAAGHIFVGGQGLHLA